MAPSRRLTPPRDLIWRPVLLVGIAAAVLYLAVPVGAQRALRPVAELVAAATVAAAIRHWRPSYATPWWFVVASLSCIALGDTITLLFEQVAGAAPPFPSVADAAYLSVTPLVATAVVLVARRRTPGRAFGKVVDSLIVAVGTALLAGVYLLTPHIVEHHGFGLAQQSVASTYPASDVMLVTLLTLLLHAGRNRALSLMRGAAIVTLLTDVGYLVTVMEDLYQPGSPVDAGWILTGAFLAAAAWHPSMRDVTDAVPDRDRIGTGRVAMLGLATLSFPAVLVRAADSPDTVTLLSVAATTTVLLGLVLLRLYVVTADASALRVRAALSQRQTEFATMAAHELRTPLTSLRGSLSTLRLGVERGLPKENQEELVRIAFRQADRLERLCRDLDVVVQSDVGGPVVVREPVVVADVVSDLVATLGADAARVSVAVDPGVVADTDAVLLGQVLENLVRNGLQHAGGSAVAVRASVAGDAVSIEVVDGGPGLPAQMAGDAFRRFRERGAGTTGGFGIGLWVVRELVTAMGGEVEYDGSNGGATFRVTLPAVAGRLAFSA